MQLHQIFLIFSLIHFSLAMYLFIREEQAVVWVKWQYEEGRRISLLLALIHLCLAIYYNLRGM